MTKRRPKSKPSEDDLWKFVNQLADFDDKECTDDPILYLSIAVAWARRLTGKYET